MPGKRSYYWSSHLTTAQRHRKHRDDMFRRSCNFCSRIAGPSASPAANVCASPSVDCGSVSIATVSLATKSVRNHSAWADLDSDFSSDDDDGDHAVDCLSNVTVPQSDDLVFLNDPWSAAMPKDSKQHDTDASITFNPWSNYIRRVGPPSSMMRSTAQAFVPSTGADNESINGAGTECLLREISNSLRFLADSFAWW